MTHRRIFPLLPDGEQFGDVARIILNNAARGKTNNVSEITLTANADTTTVDDPLVTHESIILLSPLTANAAAAVPTTYISSVDDGQFVIAHANNAQVDRNFDYTVVG